MQSKSEDEIRMPFYERVHLRGLPDSADNKEKIKHLEKRSVKKLYHLIFNILAILFFAYLLSKFAVFEDWVNIALILIFCINGGLIYQQRRQIHELLEYYKNQ